ncbi:hypothetical protein G6F27_006398 [Rhizopus arrhizus]|nr:hypothetical protein G6F27_006398 [Rhizopus arrhizus]
MSGIDNHDRNEYITTAEALALFRKLQLEEQNQRDEGLHGAELPLEISEYLDGTPAYELKEEFKRFKRQIAKYKNDNWNRPEQINKELIPELKKWKIDTFQVVSSIYKYSDNTRAQARASTEIYTQLQYLQQKVHFDNDEDREIFEGAIDQAAKLATFGFGQAKFQDNDAKELATKALRVPASLKHLEKTQDEDRVTTINNNKPKADRLEEEDIEETNAVTPDRSRDHLEEIFTKEGKVVGTISPLPATPTIPPTPINKLRSVWATEDSASLCTITTNSTTFTTTNTTNKTKTTSTTNTTNTTNTTTTTELLRSPGWNSSGGPFSPILQKLGEDRTTPMAIEDHQGGVPHSICQITQPMAIDENGNSLKGTRRNKLSGTKIFNRRNHRRRSRPKIKRIPVKILYPTGSNQETPNPGLSQDQSLYTGRTFQNGRRPGSTRSYRTWRFHGKARFTRRVHSNSYPPCFKTIFSLRKPRKALPIQVTQFWFKRRTQNILQNSSLCNRTVKKTGYPARLLSGRYLYPITRRSRISKDSQEGNQPSRVTRFHHQPKEKLTYTISRTRISGIRIQHQIDADQGPRSQDPQLDATIETSITTNNEVVSLGGQLTREDHGNVTSGGRSPIAYQTFTEVLIQEPTSTSLQLGKPMPIVPTGDRGTTMVADILNQEERPTDSPDPIEETSNNHNDRQLRHGLGSELQFHTDVRVLDCCRKDVVNQRKRTDGHLFCSEITRPKFSKLYDKGFNRQQNIHQIHDKGRRYSLSTPTGLCSENPGLVQHVQSECDIPTYQGSRQCGGGPTFTNQETFVREHDPEKIFQDDSITLGTPGHRHVCVASKYTTTKILESEARSSSDGDGCISPTVAHDRVICLPTLEVDSTSTAVDKEKEDTTNSSSDTLVADTILVSDVAGNDETMSTDFSQAECKNDTSRMAVIRRIQQNEGLSQETMQFLGDAQRSGTQRTYDTGWNKWVTWCEKKQFDYAEYNVQHVLEFLIDHQHFSTQHLNTIRSAIASVFKYTHPDDEPIALQPLIQDFFSSKRNKPVPIPADHKFKTWDIDIVIHYIKNQYSDNQMISLTHLQQKTIVLICIATMARPRSDVGKLLYQDVRLQTDDQGELLGANIHFRLSKESQLKSCTLGVIEDTTICPVHTLSAFVKRTENLRDSLPTDHTLFLAYIEDNLKRCGVRASTVANWVKDMMKKAGIDTTKYGPHSIRSAASTKAIEKGHTIEEVKEHANWSRILGRSNFEFNFFNGKPYHIGSRSGGN